MLHFYALLAIEAVMAWWISN